MSTIICDGILLDPETDGRKSLSNHEIAWLGDVNTDNGMPCVPIASLIQHTTSNIKKS